MRKGFAHFSSSIPGKSISGGENKELVNHREAIKDMFELGAAADQNKADISARIRDLQLRSRAARQVEEKTDDEGGDDSAETEPIDGKSNLDFDFMLEQVQKIFETLHNKKTVIDTLLVKLNGCSSVYKIETLVKNFY